MEIKLNSIEVAFSVPVMPSAVSKSGSVPQLLFPSFKVAAFWLFPAELAFPVLKTIPFSKGKFEVALSK